VKKKTYTTTPVLGPPSSWSEMPGRCERRKESFKWTKMNFWNQMELGSMVGQKNSSAPERCVCSSTMACCSVGSGNLAIL
jgi:hypothetical protein